MTIDIGDTVPNIAITIVDPTGAPINSTSGVIFTVTLPDGTTQTPPVTHGPTGVYAVASFTASLAGRHTWTATSTNPQTVQVGVFNVEGADVSIVSLDDVKSQLQKTGTTNDEELRGYIKAVSESVDSIRGPQVVRTVTERLRGDGAMWLTALPVVSVTSFAPVYAWTLALAASDVTVNPVTGKVTRVDWFPLVGDYDVTYRAGQPVIPWSVRLGTMMIVQYLWDTRRGNGIPAGGEEATVIIPGFGFPIPERAALLILGTDQRPMFIA